MDIEASAVESVSKTFAEKDIPVNIENVQKDLISYEKLRRSYINDFGGPKAGKAPKYETLKDKMLLKLHDQSNV